MLKTIIVGKNDADQRIDRLLTKTFPSLPVSMTNTTLYNMTGRNMLLYN